MAEELRVLRILLANATDERGQSKSKNKNCDGHVHRQENPQIEAIGGGRIAGKILVTPLRPRPHKAEAGLDRGVV